MNWTDFNRKARGGQKIIEGPQNERGMGFEWKAFCRKELTEGTAHETTGPFYFDPFMVTLILMYSEDSGWP